MMNRMRCRHCIEPAAINMRQHKLALCETHFIAWVQGQTRRSIEKYRMFGADDRVLVAVSGGKDSLALWHILLSLGYKAEGVYIDLGIDGDIGYSDRSRRCIETFLQLFQPGAKLHLLSLSDTYGESLPEVARRTRRGRAKPCSTCGLIKRHEMNRLACEFGYTVLATGHNLDDEVAVLWGNTLHWQTDYLARQSPVLPADLPGFVRKAKPLCRLYEREMAAYALISGIDYIYDECPFSAGATSLYYKEIFNEMERHSPGTKLKFYLDFLRAKKNGLFPPDRAEELEPCRRCGQPTISSGICAFCRLWEKQIRLE
jgi:tRNA-5-methyluridine54 2-sulfurtransferase